MTRSALAACAMLLVLAAPVPLSAGSGPGDRTGRVARPDKSGRVTAGQSLSVSFSAKDRLTSAPVQLDSVRIENLSTMRDTVIRGRFTIDIEISTSAGGSQPATVRSLEIGGNFANPFTEATRFTVSTGARGVVRLELFSLSGRREAGMDARLEAGVHHFSLQAASIPAGVYLLTARTGESSRTVRIVKSGPAGGGSSAFSLVGSTGTVVSDASRKPGASLYRFIGYAGTFHPDSIVAAPLSDTTIVFAMRRLPIAPLIESFACLNPNLFPGDTARFEVTASSAIQSLSLIGIDFENDGVMDDSAIVTGGSGQAAFMHAYDAAGRYDVRACAADLYGNTSCRDLDSAVNVSVYLPVLTTSAVTDITATSGRSGGNITSDGGNPVTARGVCWSASPGPTVSYSRTTDGAGTGSFESAITGLSESTTYYVRAYATNSAGTGYGNEVSFTTTDMGMYVPVLTTAAAKDIKPTSAKSGGNITSDGGYPVTARGVCWSTSPGPTTADSLTTDGTGTGSFESSITGLSENTKYYVRAYATNSAGTGYGNEVSFTTSDVSSLVPVLTTAAVTDIQLTTAKSGGNITSDGGYPVTARGVCWSTSPGPTTADSNTTDGTGTGNFESAITGLSENTKYYVRAYATNSAGTAYGNEVSFTTNDMSMYVPVLITTAVTAVTESAAKSGGFITSDGGYPVTARGVCWSTSPSPTTADSHTTDGTGAGGFESAITGLSQITEYYVRAYATNSAGTGYGNEVSFTTIDISMNLPVLTTAAVTDITPTTGKSGGNITSDGGYPVTARGVCWSTTPGPTVSDSRTTDGTGSGSFESAITGLSESTTYYVRAYATNSAGTGYGDEMSFTTTDFSMYVPVLTTTAVTDTTATTAKSGGNVTSDGGYPVTARGVCWSASSAPTTADSHTTDGTGTGSFESAITGLSETTKYYVRAYATNSAGTGYGDEVSFTTRAMSMCLPVLSTVRVTQITATSARSGGNITFDGGYPVTARGVCWSTSSGPTTADSHTADGTGTGGFSSNLSVLSESTTYYARAYATNIAGTGYGNEISFSTPQAGSGLDTVVIGTQVWMLKNLDVDKYRNGDPIPQVTDSAQWENLTTGAWCYYNNNPAVGPVHGKLYNWYAVNDPRGLAPAGWHVPTHAELALLTTYLGGELVAGGKLKEAGTSHWLSPNTGADNSSGFTAIPGGMRCTGFSGMSQYPYGGCVGNFWSSTHYSAEWAWASKLTCLQASFLSGDLMKKCGFSVRCVRD